MMEQRKIVIVGGDARQLEVIAQLKERKDELILIGYSELTQVQNHYTCYEWSEVDLSQIDLIILPVSGVRLNGEVEAVFHKEAIYLTDEMIQQTKKSCVFISGVANEAFQMKMQQYGRKLICLFDRDDLAIYNSIPTVEGTLMMVIQNTDFTIHHSNIAILGFGRIGMSLARAFHALGAKVKVGTRKSADLARIFEMGMEGFDFANESENLAEMDVIIQTIPAMVLPAEALSLIHPRTLIIDLASKPGGTDFEYAKIRGMKVIHALGLPGIVAPKTAGKMLAQVIQTVIQEQIADGHIK